ncbi:MAG: FtsX-like permease family protein [Chitinophagaceae bacterium]|nr:FtsX-like permease family protein [Chitinophagaceae bacterium]
MILQFAWRYFKGKKSTQAIQIISWVSVIAMAVGTAALIIVLSVFNGFESTIKDLYTNFYPDIKITATKGKNFELNDSLIVQLKTFPGIQFISQTLEEKVLLSTEEKQSIVTLKGVDEWYDSVTHFSENIQYGKVSFDTTQDMPFIALGLGVSNGLGADEESHFPVSCYVFKKDANISPDPNTIYNKEFFVVNALFVMPDIDPAYAFTSLSTLQNLAEKSNSCSSLEIKLKQNTDVKKVQQSISKIIGPFHLRSATRFEQNKTLFFILKSERLAVYAILTMMLLIASFNIIGSLSMLVIEKEKDIAMLKTMGMQDITIRKIFLATGVLISMIGAAMGAAIALIVCLLQQKFGLIKLGDGSDFVVRNYPVRLHASDFLLVMLTVIITAIIASWIPAVKASKKEIELRARS